MKVLSKIRGDHDKNDQKLNNIDYIFKQKESNDFSIIQGCRRN